MKRLTLITVFVLLIVFTVSCNTKEQEDFSKQIEKDLVVIENEITIQELEDEKMDLEKKVSELEESMEESMEEAMEEPMEESEELMLSGPTLGASLMVEASNIIYLMSINDYANLSLYVDPFDGVRVSPYQYVDAGSDIVLTAADVASIATYPMTNWGVYDGSGEPINLTGIDYYNQFIYNADFNTAPYIGQNIILTFGNMINNITTVYPGASYVEFYFDGFNPTYEGMDWTSLTVVMKNVGGQWYLVGLVHGQWTI